MAIRILPYMKGSKSAKALAQALGVKRLKLEGSKWKPKDNDVLINWGSQKREHPGLKAGRVLNHPSCVARASNKTDALISLASEGIIVPDFTGSKEVALGWLELGRKAVCRTVLNGHSGEGIVIASSKDEIVDAPLYTMYVPKEQEYRVHVMKGKAFFLQRKARVHDVPDEEVNWQIRNLKGGFIYSHKDVEAPEGLLDVAVKAVGAIGLTFGAVDILTTKRGDKFVLEVNTACGLAGTTLDKYVESFREVLYD